MNRYRCFASDTRTVSGGPFSSSTFFWREVHCAPLGNPNAPSFSGGAMKPHGAAALIKQTFSQWLDDKAPRLGAALAYYAIFSIPPLLVIVVASIGLVYHGDVTGALTRELSAIMGESA